MQQPIIIGPRLSTEQERRKALAEVLRTPNYGGPMGGLRSAGESIAKALVHKGEREDQEARDQRNNEALIGILGGAESKPTGHPGQGQMSPGGVEGMIQAAGNFGDADITRTLLPQLLMGQVSREQFLADRDADRAYQSERDEEERVRDQDTWQARFDATNEVDERRSAEERDFQTRLVGLKNENAVSAAVDRMIAQDRLTRAREEDSELRRANAERAEYGLPAMGREVAYSAGEQTQPQVTLAQAKAQQEADVARLKEQAKFQTEAAAMLPQREAEAANMLSVLDRIATFDDAGNVTSTHPGFASMVGARNPLSGAFTTYVPEFMGGGSPIAGSPEADFDALMKQVQGKQFLEAYQSLKGGGTITEIEGRKAEEAIARMSTSQSEEAFLEGMYEFRNIVQGALVRLRERAGQSPVTAQRPEVQAVSAPMPGGSDAQTNQVLRSLSDDDISRLLEQRGLRPSQ